VFDRPCGLVVRVAGYRSRGPGSFLLAFLCVIDYMLLILDYISRIAKPGYGSHLDVSEKKVLQIFLAIAKKLEVTFIY
jgi:hypothetical protein